MSSLDKHNPNTTQASLGGSNSFIRRYKEGKNLSEVMMGQIIKVYYKYHTVAVRLRGGEVIGNVPARDGAYAVPVLQDFAGRLPNGKPYGTIRPLVTGSLVLVAFEGNDKNKPKVIAVYGDAEVNALLKQTDFLSADDSDPTIQRELWKQFQLFPSQTYHAIDGRGNTEQTFPGHSFLIHTEQDENNDYVRPVEFQYDHLPSVYRGDGQQLEPTSPNPPTLLYTHQGIYEDYRLDFFVSVKGLFQIVMSNKNSDTDVSFLEINPDMSMTFTRQMDSNLPNDPDSTEKSVYGLNKDGEYFVRTPDGDLTIGEDGLMFNDTVLDPEYIDQLGQTVSTINEAVQEVQELLNSEEFQNLTDVYEDIDRFQTALFGNSGIVAELADSVNDIDDDLSDLQGELNTFRNTTNNTLTDHNNRITTNFNDIDTLEQDYLDFEQDVNTELYDINQQLIDVGDLGNKTHLFSGAVGFDGTSWGTVADTGINIDRVETFTDRLDVYIEKGNWTTGTEDSGVFSTFTVTPSEELVQNGIRVTTQTDSDKASIYFHRPHHLAEVYYDGTSWVVEGDNDLSASWNTDRLVISSPISIHGLPTIREQATPYKATLGSIQNDSVEVVWYDGSTQVNSADSQMKLYISLPSKHQDVSTDNSLLTGSTVQFMGIITSD